MAWRLLAPPTDLFMEPLLTPLAAADAAPLVNMAAAALRHAPLVVLMVLHLYAAGAGGTDSDQGGKPVCSKALGFNESVGPKDRYNQDLNFCTEHHKRTCCEKNQTREILNRFTTFSHERSTRCMQMTRLALCSLCDGDVGMGLKSRLNTVLLCPSFCSRWFQSCYNDYFAPAATGIHPCGPGSLVCSPLNEITESSNEFCEKVGGFAVADEEDEPDSCFDGVPAATSHGRAPKAPWVRPAPRRPPWWKQFWPPPKDFQLVIPQSLKAYLPGVIIAFVFVFITWRLWSGD